MNSSSISQSFKHFQQIAAILDDLTLQYADQPSLFDLASKMGMSPSHFQKVFSAYVGISPKSYVQLLTSKELRKRLVAGETVLEASLNSGLSSVSRAHDLLIKTEAVTPGSLRKKGEGLDINYGFAESPFGWAIVGETVHGLSHLAFVDEGEQSTQFAQLKSELPLAKWKEDLAMATERIQTIFGSSTAQAPLKLHLRGTPFQLKVWEALLQIPESACVTYGSIAKHIGKAGASRAVGSAVGANTIAWLVPCHRVIRQNGIIGQYRWRSKRKKIMLANEMVSTLNPDL